MADRTLARLRLDGMPVADYVDGSGLDADYPGVGSQLAALDPLTLPTGGATRRGLRTLLADGVLDGGAAQTWADATGDGSAATRWKG
jgi:hypothetical protein